MANTNTNVNGGSIAVPDYEAVEKTFACNLYKKFLELIESIGACRCAPDYYIRVFFLALEETKRYDRFYDASRVREIMDKAMIVVFPKFSYEKLFVENINQDVCQYATALITLRKIELEYHFNMAIKIIDAME